MDYRRFVSGQHILTKSHRSHLKNDRFLIFFRLIIISASIAHSKNLAAPYLIWGRRMTAGPLAGVTAGLIENETRCGSLEALFKDLSSNAYESQ
jgi:hypothetical protein